MKAANQKSASRPNKPVSAPPKHTGKRMLALAVVFLLGCGGAWAFAEFVVWNKLPGELVGKWVVEGGEQDGATFDFYRNGSMVGHINLQGREGIVHARVEVDGDKLNTTTTNPRSGLEETRSQTIKSLTPRTLELVDARGQTLRLSRAE